jgi:hypothetical protein
MSWLPLKLAGESGRVHPNASPHRLRERESGDAHCAVWTALLNPSWTVPQGKGSAMKAALPIVLTALLGLGSGGAVAQIAPGDPAGNQTIPEKDLSRPAEGATPHGNATSDGNQNLTDKLDKSGGVIKPAEDVDPQIVQPAPVPDPKSTPVIPPAGTPGGPPGPEPK